MSPKPRKRINSCLKGKRIEREAAAFLRGLGFLKARRGRQYRGSPDSPDLVDAIEGCYVEIKGVERLNVDRAMLEADEDGGGLLPVLLHKRNRGDWLITVYATNLIEFCERVVAECEAIRGKAGA